MNDDQLISAIVKHLDSLQSVSGWAMLLAAGIYIATLKRSEEINVFGTKLDRGDSHLIVGLVYIGTFIYSLVLFLRVENLFARVESNANLARAAREITHHQWILNPYASFNTIHSLMSIYAIVDIFTNHFGIMVATMGWTTAAYSLAAGPREGGPGLSRIRGNWLLLFLIAVTLLTLVAILRLYDVLGAKESDLTKKLSGVGKLSHEAVEIQQTLDALATLHGSPLVSVGAMVLGIVIVSSLTRLIVRHAPPGSADSANLDQPNDRDDVCC